MYISVAQPGSIVGFSFNQLKERSPRGNRIDLNDVGLSIYGTTEVVRIYASAGTTVVAFIQVNNVVMVSNYGIA
jgi:hypothetical protein